MKHLVAYEQREVNNSEITVEANFEIVKGWPFTLSQQTNVFCHLFCFFVDCYLGYIYFMCVHFRRHYIKKCEEFFKLKTEQDIEQVSFELTTLSTANIVIILPYLNYYYYFQHVNDNDIRQIFNLSGTSSLL